MAVTDASIAAVLREWARQQPDAPAYTYLDFEIDPEGYRQTLAWGELYGRVQALSAEISTGGMTVRGMVLMVVPTVLGSACPRLLLQQRRGRSRFRESLDTLRELATPVDR